MAEHRDGQASGGPLLVVDAPFLLYRSFFALPDSIRGVDGRPVNALLGATNALLRIVAEVAPRAVVICFGAEQAPYRVELYAGYHAQRPPMPEDLARQFARAPELFAALGWRVEDADELEADDLLGAHAALEGGAGGHTLLLTGDRDMYQCVDEHTRVLYLKQGVAGVETVDAAEVERRYGIAPALVPDFIALRGDPSDGLPGAPGIGEKTAATLLRRHGTLDQLLADVADGDGGERPRIVFTLREHADALRAYREIARLRPVAVTRPPDAPTDPAAGAAAAAALGMGALAARLEASSTLAER
ncbi:MAG TPA: 5'-3' exonuclease [Solirubrobacteraceae bacterium]|nr:5'-3' exonuclease [Solirubrobacteraceae bacterium]